MQSTVLCDVQFPSLTAMTVPWRYVYVHADRDAG